MLGGGGNRSSPHPLPDPRPVSRHRTPRPDPLAGPAVLGKLTYGWSGLTAAYIISLFISLYHPALPVLSVLRSRLPSSSHSVCSPRGGCRFPAPGSSSPHSCIPALAVVGAAPFLGLQFVSATRSPPHQFRRSRCWLFINVMERPMKANFKVGPLELANAFLAHLSEGSRKLDDFFRSIGESVVVPRFPSLQREGKDEIFSRSQTSIRACSVRLAGVTSRRSSTACSATARWSSTAPHRTISTRSMKQK